MGTTVTIGFIWLLRLPADSTMASSNLLLSLAALSLCLAFVYCGPPRTVGRNEIRMGINWHDISSHCRIEWEFAQSCGEIVTPLTNAIQNWIWVNQCGFSPRGEICEFISEDYDQQYSLRGVNMTFDGGFVSDIGFVIFPSSDYCKVVGDAFTTKQEVTDPDFNYCTLDWILMDSRLTSLYGFIQNTSDGMCEELKLADCSDNLDLLARGSDDLVHDGPLAMQGV